MSTDWEQVLLSFLHDPPDKALGIRGHEGRAVSLARTAFGRDISQETLHRDTRTEDQFGSVSERLPMPTAGDRGERAVGPEDGSLLGFHPLSGSPCRVNVGRLDQSAPEETLEDIISRQGGTANGPAAARRAFLSLWRCWRDDLAGRAAEWARLPADTRLPDHTIWNHMDIVAGLRPALSGNHGAAFLSFSLGPVQTFIAAARTVRDLWSGSYLLSWLTFQAMRPLLDAVGPAAFVFPALRGNPLLDRYLRESAQGLAALVPEPDAEKVLLPCLPNRFVAVVPWGPDGADARALAEECEKACRRAWLDVAQKVHDHIAGSFRSLPGGDGWDRLWPAQIDTCFEARTAVVPERECRDGAFKRLLADEFIQRIEAVRSLARAVPEAERPGFLQGSAGLWMGQLEVLARLSEASRSVRHVPDYHPTGQVPGKCSLLGTYEQMGPATLEESRRFWEAAANNPPPGGSRVGRTERLCAVSLVKRFAWPAFFAPELEKRQGRRFADTATVAAACWLQDEPALEPKEVWRREKTWSGQWLHWPRPDHDPDEDPVPGWVWDRIRAKKKKEAPPAYLAVLVMDGDHMGRWLRGEKAPAVREVLHPKLRAYFEALPAAAGGLRAQRPVGPALHASISEALSNFALHLVPHIVRTHGGELIYAGGDDVLALLPTATALACARELAETFRQDWMADAEGRERLLMGGKASVSAGLAVVHYKEDLRFALDRARQAEKLAKSAGRDALGLAVCRRSGEHSSALVPWGQCGHVESMVSAFQNDVSDRWAYKLRAELPTLQGEGVIPWELVRAETGRLLDRLEMADRDRVRQPALAFLDAYQLALTAGPRRRTAAESLEGFVTLCQAASFLARGRDER
jgi:CRISPR-associated protein Cmr2